MSLVGSRVAGSTVSRPTPSNGTARSRIRFTSRASSCTPVVRCTSRTISSRARARLAEATSSKLPKELNPQKYGMDAVADLPHGAENDENAKGIYEEGSWFRMW
jgi:hypothetical protein